MDGPPHEPRGSNEERRSRESDSTAVGPLDRQLHPLHEDDDDEEADAEHRAASRRGILSGRHLAAAGVALVVLAGGSAALALNGDGGDDDDTASSSARTDADAAAWERIVPGGDCQCADGSEFAFWDRRADPTKVVFYLEGGGVCTDATTCAFTGTAGENDYYNWSVEGENPEFPGGGILDFDQPDNPFADYSFIYVPSCTGDLYLGDVTREYSPELTVEHKGYVDGTAALSYLAEHYPDATQVVVVGKTSGSVAAPVYGGLVADLLPDAQVTVFGAQSGAFPDDPDFNAEILGELWGAYDNMPDWEVNEGLTARDWGIPRFWTQAGLHDPDIVMARFDYAFDPNAAAALESLGVDSSTLALIDANEAAIEAAGVVQHSYTAPGREHGILDLDRFYEIEVNGVRLVDWVNALIAGEPLDDVHCDNCETG
jgi:Pectinacetylesterase